MTSHTFHVFTRPPATNVFSPSVPLTQDTHESQGPCRTLSLQPQHIRSRSLQDMDLSCSDNAWRMRNHHARGGNPADRVSHDAYLEMMVRGSEKETDAADRQQFNSTRPHDAVKPSHTKTSSMPVSMPMAHVTAMNIRNGNRTPFCDNENVSPTSNIHSMCSIMESSWGDADSDERAIQTGDDRHSDDLHKAVDLRSTMPLSTSMPLWLEQRVDRRAHSCGRKISVPARLMTAKKDEPQRKVM